MFVLLAFCGAGGLCTEVFIRIRMAIHKNSSPGREMSRLLSGFFCWLERLIHYPAPVPTGKCCHGLVGWELVVCASSTV